MFRSLVSTLRQSHVFAPRVGAVQMAPPQGAVQMAPRPFSVLANNRLQSAKGESDEEFDQRYIAYFSRPNIDGWEIRKGVTDLNAMDLVPEPAIICAALKACRVVNDYAMAVRILEVVYMKCGPAQKTIWPYIVQEISPTCEELGILLPEQMGYDKPELWKVDNREING